MAFQVVVSPLFRALSDKLRSLALKEVGRIWGVDQEMNKLEGTLSTIQNVLLDAEEKQVTDKAVAVWLRKLRALAYDAEDILEEWEMDASQLPDGTFWSSGLWPMLQVCSSSIFSCFCFEQISLRRKMAKRVNELEQKFDAIAAERSKYGLTEGVVERRLEHYDNRETSSFASNPIVYGRDEERESVVGLLLSNNENISVCPIVGIGGLGKTTLAQLCYNDPRVEHHFDVRIWVCVSDNFDVKRLTKEIIVSASKQACDIDQLEALQHRLQEKLARKRFLLVLDDVWDDNQEQWSRFKSPLTCGASGSAIMVTTRLKRVAEIIGTRPPCFLKPLSEDECWLLFQQRAFGPQKEASPNLVKIGHAIVKKCGGVPLAAKVLGGLMRLKREENDWLFVRDSNIWDLPESNENTILPALRLSYTHLAPELKQCFAFSSLYPKDYEMKKEEVVRLWMANNLIQPRAGRQLEDIGNEIFDDLSWRSFFEGEEIKLIEYQYEVVYTMHDLLHDLACSINVNECRHMKDASCITNITGDTRHLYLDLETISSIDPTLYESGTGLRTLVIGVGVFLPEFSPLLAEDLNLSCFTSLRALTLGVSGELSPSFIDSITHLKHLRYLGLSNEFESLPESLCNLRNLQTLELRYCCHLKKLPNCIRHMSSLRHLDIRGCSSLTEMPIELGKLTSLRTLSIFIVAPDYGRGIDELQGLDYLSGELEIEGLEHVKTLEDAKKANLTRKRSLTSLTLSWSDSADMEGGNPKDVIEGLQPHANVKTMCIDGYRGQIFPRWLNSPWLLNLVRIGIIGCTECEYLPSSLGVLPLLKYIYLKEFKSLKFLVHDDMAHEFPSLEILELWHMPKLEEWFSGNSEEVIRFPRLKKLMIRSCRELKSLPPSSLSLLEILILSEMPKLEERLSGNSEQVIRSPHLKQLKIDRCPELKSIPTSSLSLLETLELSACNPLILGSLDNLPRLSYLEISNFTHFPEEMLQHAPSLQTLRIQYCAALQSLPEIGGTSLKYLYMLSCPDLTNVSHVLRAQTSLQKLDIFGCPKAEISAEEYHRLKSLQYLSISNIHDLASLPDGLRHLSSNLRELNIWNWSALISLPDWIETFTNLKSLQLGSCKNLKNLPDGIQHLTNLQSLSITRCHPELHRRCNKKSGEHWPMIAHVPNIRTDLW